MKKINFLLILLVVLNSCWKEEIPIAKKDRRGTTYQVVSMGATYENVVWYDMENASVVKTMKKDEWELILSKIDDHYYLQLNTALFGQAARTSFSHWTDLFSDTGFEYSTDGPSGELDSLCIGNWIQEEKIWILDRGYTSEGLPYPKLKIKCSAFTSAGFQIEYGPLNSTESTTLFVPIANGDLGIGINFSTHEILQVYPSDWDLCFTPYVHLFHDPYTPYLVTGVLINDKAGVQAQKMTSSYEETTFNSISEFNFSSKSNTIGYDWKSFDLEAGQYTVYPEMVYVLKTPQSRIFKLHFLDFYNDQGQRGYPLFEFEEL